MRGEDVRTDTLFSYVNLEERVPGTHLLRRMKLLVNAILRSMSEKFDCRGGRVGSCNNASA